MAEKLIPYIHRLTGDVATVTEAEAKKLSEDWQRPQLTKNDKGEQVFRFEIDAPVKDKNGKTVVGTAVVDLLPVDEEQNDGK